MEISVSVTDTSRRGADGMHCVFWNGKWQILINATLSGAAHGDRGLPELGGGGWMPVLSLPAISLFNLILLCISSVFILLLFFLCRCHPNSCFTACFSRPSGDTT